MRSRVYQVRVRRTSEKFTFVYRLLLIVWQFLRELQTCLISGTNYSRRARPVHGHVFTVMYGRCCQYSRVETCYFLRRDVVLIYRRVRGQMRRRSRRQLLHARGWAGDRSANLRSRAAKFCHYDRRRLQSGRSFSLKETFFRNVIIALHRPAINFARVCADSGLEINCWFGLDWRRRRRYWLKCRPSSLLLLMIRQKSTDLHSCWLIVACEVMLIVKRAYPQQQQQQQQQQ